MLHTWVVILKVGQIVHILINDDVEAVWLVMRRNVGLCESFGHLCCIE
jgi:hypothetical protein